MGTPIKEPIIGSNCGHWDPIDETPTPMYCLFEGILKGDKVGAVQAPNGHLFKLPQDPTNPCHWLYDSAAFGWTVRLGLDAGNSWLYLRDKTPQMSYYFWQPNGPGPLVEYHAYPNSYTAAFGRWGYEGYGIIFWHDPFTVFPALLSLDSADDLKLEIFTNDTGDTFLKYCSQKYGANVTLKISP